MSKKQPYSLAGLFKDVYGDNIHNLMVGSYIIPQIVETVAMRRERIQTRWNKRKNDRMNKKIDGLVGIKD